MGRAGGNGLPAAGLRSSDAGWHESTIMVTIIKLFIIAVIEVARASRLLRRWRVIAAAAVIDSYSSFAPPSSALGAAASTGGDESEHGANPWDTRDRGAARTHNAHIS